MSRREQSINPHYLPLSLALVRPLRSPRRESVRGQRPEAGPSRHAGCGTGTIPRLPSRLLKNSAPPPQADGYAREKDAGSVNSSAIDATEDTLSCRQARTRRPRLRFETRQQGPVGS